MWIHILLVVHHFLEWKSEQNSWSMRFPPVSSKNWAIPESGAEKCRTPNPTQKKQFGNVGPWAARHMPISKKMFANIVGTAGRWHGLSARRKNRGSDSPALRGVAGASASSLAPFFPDFPSSFCGYKFLVFTHFSGWKSWFTPEGQKSSYFQMLYLQDGALALLENLWKLHERLVRA